MFDKRSDLLKKNLLTLDSKKISIILSDNSLKFHSLKYSIMSLLGPDFATEAVFLLIVSDFLSSTLIHSRPLSNKQYLQANPIVWPPLLISVPSPLSPKALGGSVEEQGFHILADFSQSLERESSVLPVYISVLFSASG